MVEIKKHLAPLNKTSKGVNTKEFIVIHETANLGKGADAASHARLQARVNTRDASWHYQVDDREAIQSFDDNAICWHAAAANRRSIAIEICVNSDGNFRRAVENAAELTAHLMKKHGIPIERVTQHNRWTGKDCPRFLRNGSKDVTWEQFLAMVRKAYSGVGVTHTSTVKSAVKPVVKPSASSGGSVVDYLNSKGQDSSFAARKRLADQYGIKGYKGTAAQNTELLERLKKGAPKPPPRSTTSGGSVVDYLNRHGRDSSYSARKKLAAQYGIKNYTGTAAQNTQLLEKLQAGSAPKKKINTDSIVDFLNITGQPSSFSARKRLAEKHGIRNYTGTAAQNKKLLDILNK